MIYAFPLKGEEKRGLIFAPPSRGGDRRKLKSADPLQYWDFHQLLRMKNFPYTELSKIGYLIRKV